MERMEEEVDDSEYRAYQHFITNSSWDDTGLLQQLGKDAGCELARQKMKTGLPTGLVIDEIAHLKKGDKSVGVSRQYAGVIGKVDNCQVGVYCSLVNGEHATLVHQRLYLPESWASDPSCCDLADIPREYRTFKTKQELALAMIDDLVSNGIAFDWVSGDGLYGHGVFLLLALQARRLFYVLDVHKDALIYLHEPIFTVPPKKPGRGCAPTKPKPDCQPVRLDDYMQSLKDKYIGWSEHSRMQRANWAFPTIRSENGVHGNIITYWCLWPVYI